MALAIASRRSLQSSITSAIWRSVAEDESAQSRRSAGTLSNDILSAFRSRPFALPKAIRPTKRSKS
ncbi:hypothetical protein D1872_269210 [compost metagenome]